MKYRKYKLVFVISSHFYQNNRVTRSRRVCLYSSEEKKADMLVSDTDVRLHLEMSPF